MLLYGIYLNRAKKALFKGSTQKGLKNFIFTMPTHKGPKYAIYVISFPKISIIPSYDTSSKDGKKYVNYMAAIFTFYLSATVWP